MDSIRQRVAARVTSTNIARAQFLACMFAATFGLALVGDAMHMSTLRHHAFMVGQLVVSLAVAAVVRWTITGRRHPDLVFVVGMCVVSALGAAHLAQFGGLDGPHFYGVYTAAPIMIPILMPLAYRIAGTCATIGLFIAVYWARRPDLFEHPMVHIPMSYLFAIGVISVFTGRYVQRLEETAFVDVGHLEASTAVLDERLRVLERHPSRVRSEIARQLHDDIAQLVSGARLRLDGWSRRRAKDEGIARITELLDELAGRVKRVIGDLRQPPETGPLSVELDRLREAYREDGLVVDVLIEPPGPSPDLAGPHVIAVVAIAREALTNALRHGGAREATIAVTVLPEMLTLDVWDDGTGRVANVREGYGLLGIRERAADLGGSAELADYEHGLRLSVRIPRAEVS